VGKAEVPAGRVVGATKSAGGPAESAAHKGARRGQTQLLTPEVYKSGPYTLYDISHLSHL